MASFFNSIKESIAQAVSNFIPQASTPSGPLSSVPGDIIPLIFSFLDERSKAGLGSVCKSFNESYLYVSPVGQVCKQLNQQMRTPALELMTAVAKRPLNTHELKSAGLRGPVSSAKQIVAEEKLQAFWWRFKNTLQDSKISPIFDNYDIFALFARKIMESAFNELAAAQKTVEPQPLIKLDTTINEFNNFVFHEFCESYADQTLDKITIDTFKKQVALIKSHFTKIDVIDIEAELRRAIKRKHDTAVFNILATEYGNPSNQAPHFATMRSARETKLLAEKAALQSELDVLRGFNGTAIKALEASQQADAEMSQAFNELADFFIESTGLGTNAGKAFRKTIEDYVRGVSGLLDDKADPNIARLLKLYNAFQQKEAAFLAKRQNYEALANRFREIAGKLFGVEKQLQPTNLDLAAIRESQQIPLFYRELNMDVTDFNKEVRSHSLHQIFDLN